MFLSHFTNLHISFSKSRFRERAEENCLSNKHHKIFVNLDSWKRTKQQHNSLTLIKALSVAVY